MRHTVKFTDGSSVEIEAESVAVQPPGLYVLVTADKEIAGTFTIANVAGIWPTEGPATVKLATPGVTL